MILHVDMDAFYASVEERDRPELVGKPVIVGGTPQGRGVVAAANYVVRKFGVHSAMPTSTALRLCPQAIVLTPRMGYYSEISRQIHEILLRYSPLVEPLSLDEAFVDATGSERLFGPSAEIGRRIKRDIRETVRLVASVGVAPNKFLAKIASDLKKPDGFVVVDPERVQEFLDPLPIARLWGVGRVTARELEQLGLRTIADVRATSVDVLHDRFGKSGTHLWELAHGIDDRQVVPDREAKSISHETTFAVDLIDPDTLRAWLMDLTEQVAWRLRREGLRGRTVQLKIRFADFRTITRARTLAEPTDITTEIWRTAAELLEAEIPAPTKGRQVAARRPAAPGGLRPSAGRGTRLGIRLLGVGVSSFDPPGLAGKQKSLFVDEDRQKLSQLDHAADQIRERFGSTALHRASGIQPDRK